MAEEEGDGVGLPQKGLNMMIKDALPDMRIANETRELLNQCCVEFIKHVSREAQLISSKDQRKTIYHDHVQKALKNLGFPREYVDAANSVLGECKMAAEKRLKRKNSRLDKCGIPEEQLWQMQQRLIEQARRNEVEKQQQEHQSAFGQLMGCELQQQQMQQQFGGQQPFMAPPAGPVAGEDGMADGPTSSSSSAFASSFSSMLPPMMMPFGLTPEQLIVPSTTFATGATPAIGTTSPALDPMLEATAQLLFMPGSSSSAPQHPASGSSANALLQQTSSSAAAQEGEDEEEEEDEEEDYDV